MQIDFFLKNCVSNFLKNFAAPKNIPEFCEFYLQKRQIKQKEVNIWFRRQGKFRIHGKIFKIHRSTVFLENWKLEMLFLRGNYEIKLISILSDSNIAPPTKNSISKNSRNFKRNANLLTEWFLKKGHPFLWFKLNFMCVRGFNREFAECVPTYINEVEVHCIVEWKQNWAFEWRRKNEAK